MRAELFFDAGAELAECPVWDDRTNELVWVDILRGEIHRTSEDGTHDRVIHMGEHVGCVALTEDGGMVAGTKSGFRQVDEDAGHPLLAALPDAGPNIRLNDGKVDPVGRFVAGTMAYDETPGAGSVWSFDGNGVERLLTGVTISNGLGWSPDGETMFFVDTPTRRIDAFDYDLSSGQIGERRPVVTIEYGIGEPDGLAIDEDGGLWVALWGGSAIHRYTAGELTAQVELPDALVTSCAFSHTDLRRLTVTTAGTSPSLPDGSLHIIDTSVRGQPTSRLRMTAPLRRGQ